MKLKFIKSVAVVGFISTLLLSCANDDSYATPKESLECTEPNLTATKTVAQVIALATGSTPTQFLGANNGIIEAYVTSTDERGNFFKSISLQTLSTDGSAPSGFSVSIDETTLFGKGFTPGTKIYVVLDSLYYGRVDGSLRIGSLFTSSSGPSVGRILNYDYQDRIIPSCTTIDEDLLARPLTVSEALNNNNLNTLIDLKNVQFTDEYVGEPYYDPLDEIGGASNRLLVDDLGNQIIFRTSSFANFSGNIISDKSGTVRGVLTKFGSTFQFVARSEADIMLDRPRSLPLFSETFDTNFPNWGKINILGAQIWTVDPAVGNPGACAKMSGFSGGNVANEDWLISPAINLTNVSTASLSYQTARNFSGNNLEVLISTDYTGNGNPSSATWTTITGTLSTGSYTWTNSGARDLAPYLGNTVYIAYKYTSTTAGAPTWQVDNVTILGN